MVRRFVREYANYRKIDGHNPSIDDFNAQLDKIVRMYERGMITADEAMRCLWLVGKLN